MAQDTDPVFDKEVERSLVAQLTRDVLADAAPEEMGVFAADEAGWMEGRVSTGGSSDEMLGFGAEVAVLLTPYVVAAAATAVRYIGTVLIEVAEGDARPMLTRWIRRVLHQDGDQPMQASPVPALPVDLVRTVRDVTYGACKDMGLGDDDAGLVSDAVAGRLALAPT